MRATVGTGELPYQQVQACGRAVCCVDIHNFHGWVYDMTIHTESVTRAYIDRVDHFVRAIRTSAERLGFDSRSPMFDMVLERGPA